VDNAIYNRRSRIGVLSSRRLTSSGATENYSIEISSSGAGQRGQLRVGGIINAQLRATASNYRMRCSAHANTDTN
jgi:hypothetical protein